MSKLEFVKKKANKIDPSAFKMVANLELFGTCFTKDADLFPKDASYDELDDRYFEFEDGWPFFSLFSIAAGDMMPRRREYEGKFLQITPGAGGLPTIRDLDVLIFCVTWMANAALDGRIPEFRATYEFDVADFYEFSRRPSNGDRETQLIKAIERLAGSRVTTNLRPLGIEDYAFSLIEQFEIDRDNTGRLTAIRVKLPHTIYCLAYNEFFESIHPEYFSLSSVRRMIYLFMAMYCSTDEWTPFSFEKLHAVSGSTSPLRKFMPVLDELVTNPLPGIAAQKNEAERTMSFICTDRTFFEWIPELPEEK